MTDANHVLHSIRTRRVTRVPVTRVNTMARVPMYSRLMLSTRALVLFCTTEFSARVSYQAPGLGLFWNINPLRNKLKEYRGGEIDEQSL